MTGHRINAQGGRFQHEVGRGYQTSSRNAGRWDRRARFTWGQIAILAYCIGLTTGTIGASLYYSEPPARSLAASAPADANPSHTSAVEAGAGKGERR